MSDLCPKVDVDRIVDFLFVRKHLVLPFWRSVFAEMTKQQQVEEERIRISPFII